MDARFSRSSRVIKWTAILLLCVHASLLAWFASKITPTYDEIAHVPAGISHWHSGTFDLYRVNPPLHRLVAVIPVVMASPEVDWSRASEDLFARSEFLVGKSFTEINGQDTFWYFTIARWACIPFSILGGWVSYRWATELFGSASGLAALMLWCFCPNILGWGSVITPDVAAAALGVVAGFTFWKWLNEPSLTRVLVAGFFLGLAELTKSTWILLFLLWPLLWGITRFFKSSTNGQPPMLHQFAQLVAILIIGVYLLNLGYLFEGSFRPLKSFEFVSRTLGGSDAHLEGGNRFDGHFLGELPVPLPENYVRGIDFQKYEFEKGKWSYLRGEQKLGGWYHYYLYALLVKTPLGTLVLGCMAILLAIRLPRYRTSWRNEVVLLLPAVAILLLVSSQTGFNRYIRYVIPALPFLFIAMSRVVRLEPARTRTVAVAGWTAIACSVLSSMLVFPHSMSYFNLAVGGPKRGYQHLADANIDWGQDLLRLKSWIDNHPNAKPFHLSYFGYLNPELAGIVADPVPSGPTDFNRRDDRSEIGPQPGWHAISVNHLIGYHHFGPPRFDYSYLRDLEPDAMAGYSIYIYHLTLAEANRIRTKLGLPRIDDHPRSE